MSFNIGATADKPYAQGITAFGGKVAMLSAKFSEAKLMLVGLQETRSKQGDRSQAGDYCRIIPDPNSPAAGDTEPWFNTKLPCDPADPVSVLSADHATIVGT